MIPVVVIQPPTPPPAAELLDTMFAVCSSGLPRGRCVQRGEALGEDETPAAVVVIHLEGAEDAVLEVGASFQELQGWTEQVLTFEREDPPEERWKTIGLLVASLASGAEAFASERESELSDDDSSAPEFPRGQPAGVSSQEEPEDHTTAEAPPRPSPGRESRTVQVGGSTSDTADREETRFAVASRDSGSNWVPMAAAAVQGGRGFVGEGSSPGGARVGGLVRFGARFVPWSVYTEAGVGWTGMPRNALGLSTQFLSADLGLGYELALGQWSVSPVVRFVVEQAQVRAVSSDTGSSDQEARWVPGWGLGGSVSYPRGARWAFELQGEWLRMNGGTAVELHGERVGRIPASNLRIAAGILFQIAD